MSLNTAEKRGSVINPRSPWRSILPFPDGTVGADDREFLTYLYAGIPAGAQTVTGTMDAFSPQDVFSGTGTVNPILSEDLGDGADKKKRPIQDVSSDWEPVPKKRQSRRIFERTANDVIPIAPLVVSHETSVEDTRAAHHKRLLEEDELILKMLMN